jgi:hypothetical protein
MAGYFARLNLTAKSPRPRVTCGFLSSTRGGPVHPRRLLPIAALVAALLSMGATNARPDTDPSPGTCDGKDLVHHRHRARVLLKDAYSLYSLERAKPNGSEIRKAQVHKQCIEVAKVRGQIAALRDRLKERFRAHQAEQDAYAAITPPGPEYLAQLRACESGGDYSANTGNGFYGAYQFVLSTWQSVGGSGYPHLAAPAEQDYRAAVLWRREGSSPWPVCG